MPIGITALRRAARSLPDEHEEFALDFVFTSAEAGTICRDRKIDHRWFALWIPPHLELQRYRVKGPGQAERMLETLLFGGTIGEDIEARPVYRVRVEGGEAGSVRFPDATASREGSYGHGNAAEDRERIWHLLQGEILGIDPLGLETSLRDGEWVVLSGRGVPLHMDALGLSDALGILDRRGGAALEHAGVTVRVRAKDALQGRASGTVPASLRRPTCPAGHGHMNAFRGEHGLHFRCRHPECTHRRDGAACVLFAP